MAIAKCARARGKLPNGAIKSRKLYSVWNAMRRRCYDPKFCGYKWYGRKGITVCDEWKTDFLAFQSWALGHGFARNLTIDRIDATKGYGPDNCRWITHEEQQSNRPSWNIRVTVNGTTRTLAEWSRRNKISKPTITSRIRRYGWDPVRAVTERPAGKIHGAVTVGGMTATIYAWCGKLGISRSWVYQQVRELGRSAEAVIGKVLNEKRKTKG